MSLKGVVALVPIILHWDHVPVKYASMYTAFTDNATDVPINDKGSIEIFYRHAGLDPKDQDTFVALVEDNHKNFPPTYFANCEFDPMRDDTTVMVKALKEAGVPVKHDYWEGLPHYFWIFPSLPESQGFVGKLLQGVEWILGQMCGNSVRPRVLLLNEIQVRFPVPIV